MKRRLFIVTGISGAGKSQALKCFEDFGFFCVDNLPVALIDNFAKLLSGSRGNKDVALGIDIRGGQFLRGLEKSIEKIRAKGWDCRVLFLDAADDAVVRRFSETRHRHPLGRNVAQAIREERRRLSDIKALADKVIDTSDLTLGELKEALSGTLEMKRTQEMILSVISFGFKYGLPRDADLVMDVRFLPNPNYEPRLKLKTGLDRAVQRHVLKAPFAKEFIDRYLSLIQSLLPHYVREGKSYLTIAVGCTGGRHRSVFIARHMARELEKSGHAVNEFHRDIGR